MGGTWRINTVLTIINLRGKERRNMYPNHEVPNPGDTRYNGSFLFIKYN